MHDQNISTLFFCFYGEMVRRLDDGSAKRQDFSFQKNASDLVQWRGSTTPRDATGNTSPFDEAAERGRLDPSTGYRGKPAEVHPVTF